MPAKERRDAAHNRQRVLDAARALLSRGDLIEVTMDEIAREAGVGIGTLYRRYPHKGALCLDLVREDFARLCTELQSIERT
ncbi:MAG: TetR/AcrR family transcriptional regulator, partial [Candidatus Xenobia bacterium]